MSKDIRRALMVAKDVVGQPAPVAGNSNREANLKRHMDGNHPDVPPVLYIGTTGDFSKFDRTRMNFDNDHGRGFYATNSVDDVNSNYAGEGPDLTNRINRYVGENFSEDAPRKARRMSNDQKREAAKQALGVKHQGMVMPVHYSMKNPVVLGGENETFYDYSAPYNEETGEHGAPSGKLFDVLHGIRIGAGQINRDDSGELISKIHDRAVNNGGMSASELEKMVKTYFTFATDPVSGANAGNEVWRTAVEEAGHDGIIDHTVNNKFGSNRRDVIGNPMSGMAGVTPDTTHYIAFEPQQIKSATGNNGDFSPIDADITKARGGSVHPATQIPGVHISERIHGKPIFTGERIGKEGGGLLTGKDQTQDDEGITAYQGGPHSVGPEGYDNSKLGTGEGAHAYGYGHYFAEHEPVAQDYRDSLAHKGAIDIEHEGRARGLDLTDSDARVAVMRHADTDAGPMTAARRVQNMHAPLRSAPIEAIADLIEARRASTRGHMHQVRIQGRPEHFLDYDKPLGEQSDHVKTILGIGRDPNEFTGRLNALIQSVRERGAPTPEDKAHGNFLTRMRNLRDLSSASVSSIAPKNRQEMEAMAAAGIRGIRYLDGGSRGAGDGTRNYVVFDPKHIDIQRRYARGGMAYGDGGSTPDAGVQKALDLTRDLNPQGLYSHASEAAMSSPQAKGPLPQMLASLKGVKPDEMKYSGVEQAFADQPQVTREQLAQHFTKNIPQLKETVLRPGGGNKGQPKYQAYTLPGGENYREVLLHRPVRPQEDVVNDIMNFHREMNGIYGPRWGQEGNPLSPEHQDEYDRLEDALASQRDEYSHPHWSVPNVVGHYRVKDRTGPNGEKIMHVEEVQSDWAQQARATKKKRGVAAYDTAKPYQVYDLSTGKVVSQHATPEEALAEEESRNIDEASAGDDRKYFSTNHAKMLSIPPAGPFISSTDNATDLILKRILTEAARGNYDKVVFTPGDEQVRRWGEPGLKQYYDETIPKRLNDLVKQHDPEEKMGGHEIAGLETPAEDKDDAHHRMEERAGGELSLEQAAAIRDYLDHDRMARGHLRLGAFEEAVDHAMRTVPDAKRAFPGINVTPRLREGINKRGFKAYARGGDVEGTMRIGKAGGGPLGDDETVRRALALTAQTQPDPVQQAQPPEEPQTISSMISRGTPMPLRTPHPTREEMAAARADTRVGNQIVGQRINTIVPEIARVAGKHYVPGAPGGSRWADLPESTLQSPGKGFGKITDAELNRLWNEATAKSSVAAQRAVKENNVRPNFSAADWDAAMKLPLKDHLWYELSGEKLAENLPDLQPHEHMKLMDLIGATSARAMPGENLERSLGTLSQHLRGVPVDVDLTIPSTVRQALSRTSSESSSLPGNKTGPFSDTLAITGGVPTRVPISVNDVWVGRMFGVPDNVMSQNQSLHEPMAMYFNKLRDLYNKRYGSSLPFKYQSWNFQAPAWVHLRNKEAGATSGDAYHQVWSGIVQKLKDAGIPGIEGDKISREALMHPGFADALRRTTAGFRNAPKATVEFGTTKTPVGQQAADAYKRAMENGDEKSQGEYLSALTTAMYASARGKDHPWERLKKAITGVPGDITRIVHPTSENPLDIGGSFEGEISPNIRVPLKDMTPEQIEYFNAVAGKHLKQAAMAASTVVDADRNDPPRDGHVRGHSIFVPTTEAMNPADIKRFGKELDNMGHTFSYARYPNGYRFDVNPQFADDGPKGIDADALTDAYRRTIEQRYGHAAVIPHDYTSVYTEDSDYNRLRSNLIKGIRNDFIKEATAAGLSASAARQAIQQSKLPDAVSSRGQKAWNRFRTRLDHLSASEAGFQELAKRVNDSHAEFVQRASKRMAAASRREDNQPIGDAGSVRLPEEPRMASGGFIGHRRLPNHPIVDDALRLTSRYGQMLPDAVNLARQHTRGRP